MKKKYFIGTFLVLTLMSAALPVSANEPGGIPGEYVTIPTAPAAQVQGTPAAQGQGTPAVNIPPPNPSQGFGITNPLSVTSLCGLIKKLLTVALTIGLPIAALFLAYAGFLFVYARGNPAGLTKAKENLIYVIFGIAVFFGAWLMGQVIANTLTTLSPSAVPGLNSCR